MCTRGRKATTVCVCVCTAGMGVSVPDFMIMNGKGCSAIRQAPPIRFHIPCMLNHPLPLSLVCPAPSRPLFPQSSPLPSSDKCATRIEDIEASPESPLLLLRSELKPHRLVGLRPDRHPDAALTPCAALTQLRGSGHAPLVLQIWFFEVHPVRASSIQSPNARRANPPDRPQARTAPPIWIDNENHYSKSTR